MSCSGHVSETKYRKVTRGTLYQFHLLHYCCWNDQTYNKYGFKVIISCGDEYFLLGIFFCISFYSLQGGQHKLHLLLLIVHFYSEISTHKVQHSYKHKCMSYTIFYAVFINGATALVHIILKQGIFIYKELYFWMSSWVLIWCFISLGSIL